MTHHCDLPSWRLCSCLMTYHCDLFLFLGYVFPCVSWLISVIYFFSSLALFSLSYILIRNFILSLNFETVLLVTSSERSHFITVDLVLSLVILIKFFLRRDLWKYVKKLKEDDDWDANIHEVITWIDNFTAKSLARYSWQVDIWVFHKFRYFRLIFLANKNLRWIFEQRNNKRLIHFWFSFPNKALFWANGTGMDIKCWDISSPPSTSIPPASYGMSESQWIFYFYFLLRWV